MVERTAEGGPQHGVGHDVLDRDDHRDGEEHLADQGQGLGRVLVVKVVVVATHEGQRHQDADGADRPDEAPPESVEAVFLLQKEVAEHWSGEQPESRRREPDEAHLDGVDPRDAAKAASKEGGKGWVSPITSPRTSSFSCWPRGGSRRPRARTATTTMGRARRLRRTSATPFGLPTPEAMEPSRMGLNPVATPVGHPHGGADTSTERDRGRCRRGASRAPSGWRPARYPRRNRAQKNMKMFTARPERNTMAPKTKVATAMIGPRRGTGRPAGAHGQDPEHQEPPGDAGHKHDGPELTWNDERMFERREDRQPEPAGCPADDHGEDDEGGDPVPGQPLAQGRALLLGAREHVLGKMTSSASTASSPWCAASATKRAMVTGLPSNPSARLASTEGLLSLVTPRPPSSPIHKFASSTCRSRHNTGHSELLRL